MPVIVLAWSVLASALASRLLDNTVAIQDINGNAYLTSVGNVGGAVGVLGLLGAAAVAADTIGRSRYRPGSSCFSAAIMGLMSWWVIAGLLRHDVNSLDALYMATALLLAIAVRRLPITMLTVRRVATVLDLAIVAALLYSVLSPRLGQLPCRPDKCGIFGTLLTGFGISENYIGKVVVLLLPTLIAVNSRWRLGKTLGLAALLILATGSRTALISYCIVSLYILYGRHQVCRRNEVVHVALIWRIAPAAFLLVSLQVFLTAAPTSLTGRGIIYSSIRRELTGYALLLGSGPDTVRRAAEAGLGGSSVPVSEHGQVPHLLVQAGVPGLLLFALAICSFILPRRWSVEQITCLGLVLAGATESITEVGWTIQPRSFDYVSLLLALGLSDVKAHHRRVVALSPADASNGKSL